MAEFINTVDVFGDETVIDSIIDRTITEFKDDQVTTIKEYAFGGCHDLASVSVPNATSIGPRAFCKCTSLKEITADTFPKVTICRSSGSNTGAFMECTSLETVVWPSLEVGDGELFMKCTALRSADLPNLTSNNASLFSNCTKLTSVNLPKLTKASSSLVNTCTSLKTITLPSVTEVTGGSTFRGSGLEIIDLPVCTTIAGAYTIGYMDYMKALVLRSPTMCALNANNIFNNNKKLAAGTGFIYVPRSLVDSYKAATNWSTYASAFRALEDYTVDGTTTGALDESKI